MISIYYTPYFFRLLVDEKTENKKKLMLNEFFMLPIVWFSSRSVNEMNENIDTEINAGTL